MRCRPRGRMTTGQPAVPLGDRHDDPRPPPRGPFRPAQLGRRRRRRGDRDRHPDRDARRERAPPEHRRVAPAVGHPAPRPDRLDARARGRRGRLSVVLGVSLAWLVSAYRFPGRRVLSWALVLPLAMPGYILGFVTTSVFGVAGPVQTWWRDQFGRDAWFPEVRSMPVAIVTLSLTLYPYVYLMARAALRDQAAGAYLVARTLGASRGRGDPAGRAADAAAGDRGRRRRRRDGDAHRLRHRAVLQRRDRHRRACSGSGRGTYDRDAASEIAIARARVRAPRDRLERVVRGRARFGESGGRGAGVEPTPLGGGAAPRRRRATATVVLIAFAAPVGRLDDVGDRRAARRPRHADGRRSTWASSATASSSPASRWPCASWCPWSSPTPGGSANPRVVGVANRLSAVGYAVPGPVVGMGVVLALVALDDRARRHRTRPARLRRDRVVRRPRLRLRDPLPRARRWAASRPGSGRSRTRSRRRPARSARSPRRRDVADPPAAVAARACWPPRCSSASTP